MAGSQKPENGFGANILLVGLGSVFVGLMVSVFAVDGAFYFAAQNQLQTVTDAAALAGAQEMFKGSEEAEEAALDYAMPNQLPGMNLNENDLGFEMTSGSFKVNASTQVPTVMKTLLCAMAGKVDAGSLGGSNDDDGGPNETEAVNCKYTMASARSQAVSGPRDTVLVLDTSSSMDDLGHGQPFKDVKTSAQAFLDRVVDINEDLNAVDRVAIVKFDKTSKLVSTFVSPQESPGLATLKTALNKMTLYTGSGWNTNYEAGLKTALDELEARGRDTASKTIIFFTDGEPNLPEGSTAITTCLYYKDRRQNTQAKNCAKNYTNYMISKTNTQIARAKSLGVTIHTIQISDAEGGSSLETLRDLLMNNSWEPGLVDAMDNETEGEQFEAASADGAAIMEIFETAAKLVHVKLAKYEN